jgi:transcriptional regulator with XRE-family HTH domain
MARASNISDFGAKLTILLDRLNWSRGQLAQRAGVDKSVAQRWVRGQVQPGEANLVSLTAAVRGHLPEFGRPDWRLPLDRFAERFGPSEATPMAALFARTAAAVVPIADATARYGGFWLLLHTSVQTTDDPRIVGYLASIAPRGGMLWMEVQGSVTGTWRAAGPVFPIHRLVYLILEDGAQGDSFAFAVLHGVAEGRAMVLDGIGSSAASSLRGPASATRLIALRLDDHPDPPWRGHAMRRLVRHNAGSLARILPAALAARFSLAPVGAASAARMLVTAETSLSCDAEDVASGLAPEAAEALAAGRALCGLDGGSTAA